MSEASLAGGAVPKPAALSAAERWAWLPAGLVTLLFVVLVVPPIVVLVKSSLTVGHGAGSESLSFDNYRRLFGTPNLYSAIGNSLFFASAATLVGLACGGILAWIVERTNAPLKGLVQFTAIVSMGTPYILYVIAWLYLLGRAGPFYGVLRDVFGFTDIPFNVYSMWGMVLIEGFLWSPLIFLMLTPVFRRSGVEMEEAARMCGASVPRMMWHISLRLALPAIIGTAMFVFIRNLEAFDAPVLIGMPGRVNLLTTEIYLNVTRVPSDHGLASAFSVVLISLVAFFMWFLSRFTRHASRFASITGKGFRPRPLDLGGARWIAGGIVLLYFVVVLLLPLGALAWLSLMPFLRQIDLAGFGMLTLQHYRIVLSDSSYFELARNTLVVAASAATITMALTVVAGWLSVRRWPGSVLLSQITAVPLVFPGVVLAVAMIQIALQVPFPLYGTLAVIAIAFVIRYTPYGMRYSYAGVLQIHKELEEAGQMSGASQIWVLIRIVAPLLAPAIVTGWLFIFLLASKELSIAVLLSSPTTQTMAVSMFSQLANGTTNELAAMGIVWTSVLTVCAVIFHIFAKRQARDIGG